MLVRELLNELYYCGENDTVAVEIDGVVHDLQLVKDDSQGVYIVVDTLEEERKMR